MDEIFDRDQPLPSTSSQFPSPKKRFKTQQVTRCNAYAPIGISGVNSLLLKSVASSKVKKIAKNDQHTALTRRSHLLKFTVSPPEVRFLMTTR